jgi:hypothetical protein
MLGFLMVTRQQKTTKRSSAESSAAPTLRIRLDTQASVKPEVCFVEVKEQLTCYTEQHIKEFTVHLQPEDQKWSD